jgi:CheY-like chemotaxis protein
MPSKTVLSIGQCRPDNAAITHFLTSNFDVDVLATDLADDSLTALQKKSVDLILINRKLDADYSDGMEIMNLIKSNPQTEQIPVMLISNFPESQEQAVEAGATYGFGKAELSSPETIERVRDALGLA